MSIITISRGAKSGGEELARQLSMRLGYKAINREIITECSKKYNIMEGDLLEKLEEAPRLWHRLTREHGRQLIYIKCSLLDAAKQDSLIYYGHAGQLFLAGISHVLKLRLEAPRRERVEVAMRDLGKSYDKAVEYINEIDRQRVRWVKLLYDEDWHDPSLYDLTVNLQNMSITTICNLVETVIGYSEFKTTDRSLRILNDISTECEVKAAIAADDKIWDQPITISANKGVVTLRGTVKSKRLRDLIAEAASLVKGVKKCDVRIGLSTDPIPNGKYWKE